MYCKKFILFALLLLSGISLAFGQSIQYDAQDTVLFTGTLSGIVNNQSDVWFKYGGNNFGGLFFLTGTEILSTAESVQFTGVNKSCYKRIKGVYYSNQRGMRFRPLDADTLIKLKTITGTYDDLFMTGGLFMGCNGSTDMWIYGDITHTIGNTSYELIAGVGLNTTWNNYFDLGLNLGLPTFGQTLRYVPASNGLYLSGHVFDSYGGIGQVWGSGMCVDTWGPAPSTVCYNTAFTQYSNCGNTKTTTGTKNCTISSNSSPILTMDNCCTNGKLPGGNTDCDDESLSYYDHTCVSSAVHQAPGVFCKYDDEKYLTNGMFPDTKYHRGFDYIEIMRKSCLHRGQGTWKGKWTYGPNESITRAATLKTLVKILGISFDDFSIETEDVTYPGSIIFADVNKNHWFARYTRYAYSKGLTDDLYMTKGTAKHLSPDIAISRNEIIKKIMITYHMIYSGTITLSPRSNLTDVHTGDPYYRYIREAESLGFISGSPQKDGTYKFNGKRSVTRAEFAKMIAIPFNGILFDEG